MKIRQPIVAGQFYDAVPAGCRRQAQACIPQDARIPEPGFQALGGVVPHAGWSYSGRIGGRVLKALAEQATPQTVVLLGAVHARRRTTAAVYDGSAWDTPLGRVRVAEGLAEQLVTDSPWIQADSTAHDAEHSLEVQVPLIQLLFPDASILPVMVPPIRDAAAIGLSVGRTLQRSGVAVVVVGTSDLTHYGPRYGLTSHGVGAGGLEWAKQHNDRRMIQRMLALDADGIVPEAVAHHNACGGGAIAATIAACRQLGAVRSILLEHTTSRDLTPSTVARNVVDAVGYAGLLFGK